MTKDDTEKLNVKVDTKLTETLNVKVDTKLTETLAEAKSDTVENQEGTQNLGFFNSEITNIPLTVGRM
jgi:hypothetical protein